ncbi:MAG TPA: hypothetical protein VGG19_10900 [Tepidisphaeraceae bacterium]
MSGARTMRLAGLVLTCTSACLAVNPPATQPNLQTMKQEEFARQLMEKAAILDSKQVPLSGLIHVNLRDGRLYAESPVKTDEWLRINVGNPLMLCVLRQPTPDFLQITLQDFTDPTNIYMQTEILGSPAQLQIVGSWEFPGRERFVTLIEKYASLDEQGRTAAGQTRLLVQEMTDDGGETVNLTLAEPDWSTLLREHPREMRQYFYPVLEELHAQALLQPDSHVEWQIFGPQAKPDAATMARVQQLLPLLDSETFSQRQSALRQISAMGPTGALALMHVDEHSLSPEQSARVADILLPYRQLSPQQAVALSRQPEFLLDCMDSENADLRRLAKERLEKVLKHAIAFEPTGAEGQREMELGKLRRDLLKQ